MAKNGKDCDVWENRRGNVSGVTRKMIGLEAEIGEHFLVRDALAVALLKPGFRFRNGMAFLLCLRLIVERSIGDGARNGVKHRLL